MPESTDESIDPAAHLLLEFISSRNGKRKGADFYHALNGSPDPAHLALAKLAEEYESRCEVYDRTVCTGPMGHDGILPATIDQKSLISRNARAVLKDIADRSGFPESEIMKAIQRRNK